MTERPVDHASDLHDLWVLTSISQAGLPAETDFKDQKIPVLEINLTQMKIFGNDGCNALFGTISLLQDSYINFRSIGGTKIMCPNMALPNAYVKTLVEVASYKREQLELFFFDDNGNEIMRFRKID